MDVSAEVKEPNLFTKNNTQEVAHQLFEEMSEMAEVEVAPFECDEQCNVVIDNQAQSKTDPNVEEKVIEQQGGIVKARNDIESEHEPCSFTEKEPHISANQEHHLAGDNELVVENDVIALYRSPLEAFIDSFVTMTWKGFGGEQRTCSLSENVVKDNGIDTLHFGLLLSSKEGRQSVCRSVLNSLQEQQHPMVTKVDVLAFNVHNQLGKMDGCSCVVPFDPGGEQGVSKLMQTPIWLAFDPGGRSHAKVTKLDLQSSFLILEVW